MKRLLDFFRHYKLFGVAVVTVIVGLVLELTHNQTAARWLLSIVASIEVLPLLWDMWQNVRSGAYGIDILAATAIIASVILGQYWAAIVVVIMLTGGEALEDFAERRAHSELDALLAHAPEQATVLRKNKPVQIAASELRPGDKIIIKAGDLVPVDAVVLSGVASFDESSLTGESLPQAKQTGDTLLSGAINLDGEIIAKASSSAEDSQYQQIIKLVQSAAASRAPFVRLAERYSLPFTFVAYAIACAVWVETGQAIRFLEVIIVATPCPLLLAAPIALISGMSRASHYGIIVKTGAALEQLASIRTIAFDKTGTLTRGELTVDQVVAFGGFKKDEVLQLAASLEQSSNHVVARAIIAAATARKLKLTKAKHVREIPGRGLIATLKAQTIIIGRFNLIQEHGVKLPTNFKHSDVKQTAVYIAVGDELAGVITLKDDLRPETTATLSRLRTLGIHNMLMITGDNQATAEAVAKQIGIDHVHAETLPADKLHILGEIKERPLAFVGDGINDAPVLSGADVGVALGARGSTAASESADIVIMLDEVGRVATAYELAKRTFRIAQQSIIVGILLSVILMLVFASGKFSPLAGAIVQEVVDVIVIFNALRAHLIKAEPVQG